MAAEGLASSPLDQVASDLPPLAELAVAGDLPALPQVVCVAALWDLAATRALALVSWELLLVLVSWELRLVLVEIEVVAVVACMAVLPLQGWWLPLQPPPPPLVLLSASSSLACPAPPGLGCPSCGVAWPLQGNPRSSQSLVACSLLLVGTCKELASCSLEAK